MLASLFLFGSFLCHEVVDSDTIKVQYDLVIRNGRIINPETSYDRVANVGIKGERIAAVTTDLLRGKKEIDATGLIVAPGFIDILSYNPNPLGVWNKIADGVTTNLAMHGGTVHPEDWYPSFEKQRPPLNFGASFFYMEARSDFIANRYRPATKAQIEKLSALAEKALQNGALGISFSLEYCPGISTDEVLAMMTIAKRYDVPVFFHARYSDMEEPGTNIDALNELIGFTAQTGASTHIDHINSTGGTFSMERSLSIIDSARSAGLDITACVYPYNFWATYLNSARFDQGWQSRFHISYGDLQLGGSSERLTDESFEKYQKQGKLAVAYAIPEKDVEESLRSPFVMIGSDAILNPGYNNHPRASGAFARTIGYYVREKQILSLMDALAKMTILPAKRIEKSSSAMKRKGRIAVDADADIVVFDLNKIIDRATVEHPEYPSAGVEYVLVGGKVAKDPKGLNKRVRNGKAIKNDHILMN